MPSVVLPEPDSPTMPSVSPSRSARLTSSTATSSCVLAAERAAPAKVVFDPELVRLQHDLALRRDRVGPARRRRRRRAAACRDGAARRRAPLVSLRLDHVAVPHDGDAVADLLHDGEVVGDEEHAHVVPRLKLPDQLQDFGLHGHVERGRRLVGDQEFRVVGDRHRDHHALPLPAGELMRILLEPRLRLGDAHFLQEVERAGERLLLGQALMQDDRLGDLAADPIDRVQRRHRLLEDHRDAVAADVEHLPLAELVDARPREQHAAFAGNVRRPRQELHDGARRHRLAGARFADQRQRLAAVDVEGHVLDRLDLGLVELEGHREVLDLDQMDLRLGVHPSPQCW